MIPATMRPDLWSWLTMATAAGGGEVHAEFTCGDMAGPLQAADDVGCHRARLRAVESVRSGDDDQQPDITLAELVGQKPGRAGRLGVRIFQAAGRQALGDRDAEQSDSQHGECDDGEDAARRG